MKTKTAVFLLLIASGGIVTAQARIYRIDIRPNASTALWRSSPSSPAPGGVPGRDCSDIESAGFSGEGRLDDVLPALLEGSGLAWRLENERTVSIVEPTESEDQGPTAERAAIGQRGGITT